MLDREAFGSTEPGNEPAALLVLRRSRVVEAHEAPCRPSPSSRKKSWDRRIGVEGEGTLKLVRATVRGEVRVNDGKEW